MDQQPVNAIDQAATIKEHLRLFELAAHEFGLSYADALRVANRQLVIAELERHDWHQCNTARALKMHRNALGNLMVRLNIKKPARKPAAKVEEMLGLAARCRRA